jgi:membrane protein
LVIFNKLFGFIKTLADKSVRDRILSTSNELSFKLLLALFPLIMLCLLILGFLNIESEMFLNYIDGAVPDAFSEIARIFVIEVVETRSIGLISVTLFIAIFSASSGFNAVIRIVNKSFNQKETRNIITVRLLSIALVFVFVLSIASAIVFIAINTDILYSIFPSESLSLSSYAFYTANFFAGVISLAMILLATMVIYKLASCKKVRFINVLPGSLFSVISWFLATKAFSIYISNFSDYSRVYGSIGSVVILMIWVNILSVVFLLGSEINAVLMEYRGVKR